MTPFVFGKHPAFGDFLSFGGNGRLATGLDRWLEGLLPRLKEALGAHWEMAWASAPPLRFWIGPEVLGVPAQGLFLASRDRVGRKYPLIVGLTDTAFVPPIDPRHSEAPYEALWNHILIHAPPTATGFGGSAELLDGFEPPAAAQMAWQEGQNPAIWGHRADGDLPRLFADARGVEAEYAQYHRSHWWHPALTQRAPGWLAVNGLPDLDALQWLLTERWQPAAVPAAPEDSDADETVTKDAQGPETGEETPK